MEMLAISPPPIMAALVELHQLKMGRFRSN